MPESTSQAREMGALVAQLSMATTTLEALQAKLSEIWTRLISNEKDAEHTLERTEELRETVLGTTDKPGVKAQLQTILQILSMLEERLEPVLGKGDVPSLHARVQEMERALGIEKSSRKKSLPEKVAAHEREIVQFRKARKLILQISSLAGASGLAAGAGFDDVVMKVVQALTGSP